MNRVGMGLLVALYGLGASADHIEEVVVRGSHEKRTMDVIDEMAIAPDAAQLLKKAPGANVNENGPLTGLPSYRGMYGSRVAVELNGSQIAPAGPNWMDPALSYAAAAQLESLQVYRGIAPVSVAQESIGGAVHAVTAKGEFSKSRDMQLAGHLLGSAQSVNQGSQLGATLFATNQNHRLRLAAMTEQADDAEFPKGDIIPSEYERDRFDLGYGFRSRAHTIQLDYTRSETGDTGTAALPMDIEYIDGDLYGVSYQFSGREWLVDARIYGSDLDHGMTNYHLRPEPADGAMWRRNIADAENRGFKVAASYRDDAGAWIFGLDGLKSVHNSDIDNPNNEMFFVVNFNDAERQVLGAFVERQHNFNEAWSAEFGLRYNRIETDADEVNGTPAIMMPPAMMLRDAFNAADREKTDDNFDLVAKVWYEASHHVSLYAGVAQKMRAPSYQERYLWLPLQATGGLGDGRTYIGNLDLDSERSREAELGLDFNGSGWMFSPRVFYRQADDYIQGTPADVMPAMMFASMMGQAAPLQFNNVDALIYGFDMDWRYSINDAWSVGGLVNYVRGERDDIDDNLYRIPPLNGSVKLAYDSMRWGASAELVAHAEQDKVSATNSEGTSKGFELLHVSAYWQANQDLRLGLGVDNLFDENYADHVGGVNRVRGNPDIAVGDGLPGYGRNVYARIDYQF